MHEANTWVVGPFLMQMPDTDKIVSKVQSAVNLLSRTQLIHETPYGIINKNIEHGDKTKLDEMMPESKHWYDFLSRFPNQPVRAMKNMLIILNTILRIAAEKGKVHPFFLHHLSEKFSKQIERSESINSLNAIVVLMFSEYCDLVKSRAVLGYSSVVQKAAQHITVHFSKSFDLNQLSEYCLVHPAHLSRQFKKETGMTLTVLMMRDILREYLKS
ncbi:hypothetical protein MHI37_11075 [Paenibacillus sp. FSL H8-0548]|uniref:hypothetical protein n=1 Tax=Paenibacillus sp. FSL H8-0548 TaxID=1920422 RepID=UPI0009F878D8|nr:hypothetical protein [Paenibacillus sp. FSL H8-0548]